MCAQDRRAVWSVFIVRMNKNFASLAIQNAPSEDSGQIEYTSDVFWRFLKSMSFIAWNT